MTKPSRKLMIKCLMKDLYTVINDFLGNKSWSLRKSPIVLLTFLKIISRCSLKSNLESKTIPKCFWDSVKLTVLWLKIKHGWLVFWSFQLKITSCAYLIRSGLKFILHWNAQVLILAKSLFNSLADLIIFTFTESSDVSPAKYFALDAKLSDKLFMYIRKNIGSSIERCWTPASIVAHEEYCQFRTILCFRWCKKSFTIFNSLPNMPFSLSLWRRPSFQTL